MHVQSRTWIQHVKKPKSSPHSNDWFSVFVYLSFRVRNIKSCRSVWCFVAEINWEVNWKSEPILLKVQAKRFYSISSHPSHSTTVRKYVIFRVLTMCLFVAQGIMSCPVFVCQPMLTLHCIRSQAKELALLKTEKVEASAWRKFLSFLRRRWCFVFCF